jgi:uncharacterized membrane protein YoaK (UPF0700 family)
MTGLMLALTFSTGIVDAVGYLGLDRVFTGNMTGNVVILGMALAGGDGLPVVGPVIALVAFCAGAVLGGRVLRSGPAAWNPRTTLVFTAVGGLMLVVGTVLLLDEDPVHPLALTVTGLLGAAMGLQAAAARRIGVKDVTTVVVTSTLTGLAADSRLAGAPGTQDWRRRAGAVALILLGAATGALLLHYHLAAAVGLATTMTLVVAFLGHRWSRGEDTPSAVEADGA